MPRGNGTGPAGMGPMTGRAMGYCAGYPTPGYMNPYGGRMGGGFGRVGLGAFSGYPAAGMGGSYASPYIAGGAYPPYGGMYGMSGMYGMRGRFVGLRGGRGGGRRRW
jgi:hypothetical protein